MIERKIAPALNEISTIDYVMPEEWVLDNGIKVWGINAGSQDLVKIDFIFEAGTWYQPKNLIAGLTNAFMNQGSKHHSAQQIAEVYDFRGAYLQLTADQQFGNVTVLTLTKYIDEILKVTADIVMHPTFPQKEISAQIGKKKQQFIIENNKVKTLAQKRFSQVIFGEDHPYSNTNKIEDYDQISSEDFVSFHHHHYTAGNCRIVVAGRYNDEVKKSLNRYFGGHGWLLERDSKSSEFDFHSSALQNHFVDKDDALQNAIRIGRLVPNREHRDFHGISVLTTILGGYFGSRLMTNIREEKGYTYGIGASIYTLPNAAYFSISTEVGVDVTADALKEIYIELERLQNELVGEEELEVVKNYLLGENLRNFDGVFAMSNSLKTLLEANLWYEHYDEFVKVTRNITPIELKELAKKYFSKDTLFEIVAGKR